MEERPTSEETEEDLLRLQAEFLKSKAKPAASLIRVPDKRKPPEPDHMEVDQSSQKQRDVVSLEGLPDTFPHTSSAPPVKKSKVTDTVPDPRAEDIKDPEEAIERHDQHITKVLTDIMERDIMNIPVYYPRTAVSGGFPAVIHRGTHSQGTSEGGKKKSIFAQQFSKRSARDYGISVEKSELVTSAWNTTGEKKTDREASCHVAIPTSSDVVQGTGLNPMTAASESRQIHEENIAKMASMSEEQIFSEQRKLLETLDPSIVAFLASKRKAKDVKESIAPDAANDTKSVAMEIEQSQPHTSDMIGSDELQVEVMKLPRQFEEAGIDCPVDDIPFKPKEEWVHMKSVEYDKLAWMKDLPSPKAGDSKTGKPARFDFEGKLIAVDADIPTHIGLHHHGQEPERAGYSLEELYQLARSVNMQQRVLAITTIGRIIKNARLGEFYERVSTNIIPALLDGGLIFVLRWALDDKTDNTIAGAIQALHSLLVVPEDEEASDWTFCWYLGHRMPSLCSSITEDQKDQEEEDYQPTDADIVKQDVIKGLLRMSLLERLRYLLDKWRPAAGVVTQILDILIRIARHSMQAAYQITQCQNLLDVIFKHFLPITWDVVDTSSPLPTAYGYPLDKAMKLGRVICAAGRNMAAIMLHKYSLMERVTRYITQSPCDMNLHREEAEKLLLESLRFWKTSATYGLALTSFSDLYSVLMEQLRKLTNLNNQSEQSKLLAAATQINMLESLLHSVATSTRSDKPDQLSTEDTDQILHQDVTWNEISSTILPGQVCLQTCLRDFEKNYFDKKFDLSFTSSCLNFVASYFERAPSQAGYNVIDTLEDIEAICDNLLIPCLKCRGFQLTLKSLRANSMLLWSGPSQETCPNLVELGSLVGAHADICPVTVQNSTIHFLIGITRLLLVLGRLNKTVIKKTYSLVLEDEELLQYLRKLCNVKASKAASNHFSRFENLLQYTLVTMSRLTENCDRQLYHLMSLYLLTHLHHGDEYIAHDLLSTVIFNQEFLKDIDGSDESDNLDVDDKLLLTDTPPLTSATRESISATKRMLVNDTLTNLPSIRNTYLTAVAGLSQHLHKSKSFACQDPLRTESLQTAEPGQLLAPVDWAFLPLIELYNKSITSLKGNSEESVAPSIVAMTTNTLRWIHVMECWRTGTLELFSISTKLSRLMCVFLAGSDLFLNTWVQSYLTSLLRIYCKPVHLRRVNFEQAIPGLASFYDMYIMVLKQYEAVSFGDSLFGCIVLLPLQQIHSITLRKAVWGEYAAVLRSLIIPLKQLIIPLNGFLEPEETDVELLRLYFQALFSNLVSPKWCPLPYLIAVHHVNRFFYTQDSKHRKLKYSMIKHILDTQHTELRHHLIYYKKPDIDCYCGLDLYQELPSIRQSTIDKATTANS